MMRFSSLFLPRRGVSKSTLFAIILHFASATANAVCPRPIPAPNAEFFKTSMVITGKVVSEKPKGDPNFADGWFYRLRVQRTFRGAPARSVVVYTENDNGRFPLKVGERYLLFVFRVQGRLEVDGCGNSALLSEASAAINAIEAIRHAGPYGEIEGRVRTKDVEEAGIPGVRVIAHGHRSYLTATVDDGWFHMRAPPGTYKLTTQSPNLVREPQDSVYNFDEPDHFVVHRGSSAHFEYFAAPK